ncbi:MAG: hypothetical protein ABI615_01175 [Chthoniobacterales bacterium]
MTEKDETTDASTHVADLGKFSRCIFIYWVTTLAVATLITGLFVAFMGVIRQAVL